MQLAVFLPTLFLAAAFAAAILLYSLQKVFGPGILSFRNKTHVGTSTEDASSQPGWMHCVSTYPGRVQGLGSSWHFDASWKHAVG